MTRDLTPDGVRAANESLLAAGASSLTEMRHRIWRVIPKVLARGHIRNIDEFYVIKNVVCDGGKELSDNDRSRLDRMLSEFETRSAPTPRPRPAGRRQRPPGTRPSGKAFASPRESEHVPSPSGWCEAYVVEWSPENSQVMLSFDGGRCGGGAVSALGRDPGLKLRWLDPTTLEVQHAGSVRMDRSPSGEIIQGGGPHRRVRVVLRAG